MRQDPLECRMQGGTARFEHEARFAGGSLYAAVKHWRGAESELVHRRAEHTLVLTLAGGTKLTGNKISGAPVYEGADRAGSVSFVPSGAERRGWYRDAEMDFVSLLIAPRFLERVGVAVGDLPAFTNRRDALLGAILHDLATEMRAAPSLPTAYAEHAAGLVMAHLVRCAGRRTRSRRDARLGQAELARVVEFIDAELGRDLSVVDLAAVVDLSPDRFARRFKQQTGMPPYRFLLERRMARARQALAEERTPIADLALALGFSNQSHFTSVFRRFVGVSPAAYRKAAGIRQVPES